MTAGPADGRRRGRAQAIALVLVAFAALLSGPATAAAQVAVDELELHFSLAGARSGTLTQVVPVRNEKDRVQQIRLTIGDWERDSLGRNAFYALGQLASSCKDRVKAFPTNFQLQPGAVEYVRITYEPGTDVAGCWSIVMFESVQPPRPAGEQPGSFLTIEIRTGVKVYVHPAAPTRAGELAWADVVQAWVPKEVARGQRPDSVRAWQADVRFVNTGTDHLKLQPRVEIRDRDGKLLHTVTSLEAYLTPKAVRDLRLTLPDLPSGDYVALVMIDFGGDEITAAQVEFKVP